MKRYFTLITILALAHVNAVTAGAFDDDLRLQFVFVYEFDSGFSKGRVSDMRLGIAPSSKSAIANSSARAPATRLSCVGCTEDEIRRAGLIYGLAIVAGYFVLVEATE